jgi:hypothetical protein
MTPAVLVATYALGFYCIHYIKSSSKLVYDISHTFRLHPHGSYRRNVIYYNVGLHERDDLFFIVLYICCKLKRPGGAMNLRL